MKQATEINYAIAHLLCLILVFLIPPDWKQSASVTASSYGLLMGFW